MGGEKPLGQMLHLIPTACLGRDVRLYSYRSDLKHLQQHLGPVKINSKTLLNAGLRPGHENREIVQKRPELEKSYQEKRNQRSAGAFKGL